MNISVYIFYFFAFITIASGVVILLTKNVLHAAFALLCVFLGVAVIYVFAGADFLALAQIMVYIGGILILILFGVMLTNRIAGHQYLVSKNRNMFLSLGIGLCALALLVISIIKANFNSIFWIQNSVKGNGKTTLGIIGKNLMTGFVLPFEVVALILMVALMGAAFIASQVVKNK